MKKILGFTLVSLALSALSASAEAGVGRFGGSVRGDVGELDSQVPYFGIETIVDSTEFSSRLKTFYSDRKRWNWDFTGRLFAYINCSLYDPCPTYVAASWQGSDHTVNSHRDPYVEGPFATAIIPIRANGKSGFLQAYGSVSVSSNVLSGTGTVEDPFVVSDTVTVIETTYDTVVPCVRVHNEFSKTKLGVGFDLIRTGCFGFTMEVGANYLTAKLGVEKQYHLTADPIAPSSFTTITGVAPNQVVTTVPTGNIIIAPTFSPNLDIAPLANSLASTTTPAPFDFIFRVDEFDKTEGLGLYAMIKGEYKFSLGCFGNCFSVYGKAEVADIIGRQSYQYDFCYNDQFAPSPNGGRLYVYSEIPERQYNNIVEVDLEAAIVYSPCFKCWDDLDMSFAIGIRTDSFLHLFSHLTYENNQSIWNLTRSSLFFEVGIKV